MLLILCAVDDTLAVIGFLIEVAGSSDTVNPLLAAALANVGEIPESGDITSTDALDFSSIESHLSGGSVFQYGGSLTTPPCDEGVTFNVAAAPLFVDVATYRAVKNVVKFNSRYTQNSPGSVNLLDNARNVLDA